MQLEHSLDSLGVKAGIPRAGPTCEARQVACHRHPARPDATLSDMTMTTSSSAGLSFASVRGYQIWEQIGSGGFSK